MIRAALLGGLLAGALDITCAFVAYAFVGATLDYYDNPDWPDTNQPPRVVNEADPEAVTLLAAHVEYWRNWHVFKRLHAAFASG